MNRIVCEQEQLFVNKRSILCPQTHDISQYDLMPEKEYAEMLDANDENRTRFPRRVNQYDDEGDEELHGDKRDRFAARNTHQYRRYESEDEEYFNKEPPTHEELTKVKRYTIHDVWDKWHFRVLWFFFASRSGVVDKRDGPVVLVVSSGFVNNRYLYLFCYAVISLLVHFRYGFFSPDF